MVLGDRQASSSYSGRTPEGGFITVWAFGCFCAEWDRGGVFLRRYGFTPLYTSRVQLPPGVFSVAELPPLDAPRGATEWKNVRVLVERLLRWMAHYEHWVAETCGASYREECLQIRPKPAAVPGRDMAREWERLAKCCRQLGVYGAGQGGWGHLAGCLQHLPEGRSCTTQIRPEVPRPGLEPALPLPNAGWRGPGRARPRSRARNRLR